MRVALGVGLIAITAALARVDHISELERDVFRVVNDLPNGLRVPLVTVMQLGSFGAIFAMVALALLTRRRWLALDLGAAGAGAYFAAHFGKELIERGRPARLLTHVVVRGHPVIGFGYPSGHAAVAAGLAAAAVPYMPRPARRFAWGLALVVGFARVYVGAHFPLDVVGGLAIGWAIGAIVNLAVGTPRHPEMARVP